MTNERSIYDVPEAQIKFISDFLVEQCIKIDPKLDAAKIVEQKKLMALEMSNEQYIYFFNKKIPLIFVDLKLLIDGV